MEVNAVGQKLVNEVPQIAQSKFQKKGMVGSSNGVSFQGAGLDKAAKYGWHSLKNLSKSMKEISEITNALIAAIGTGIIAPFIILVSPGKGDKEDKDKKFFQAIRQPLSAALQLSFQVPATIAINRYIDKLTYKDHKAFFNDDTIGTLIPDAKYIKRGITNEELADWEAKFDKVIDGKSSDLRKELEASIKEEYADSRIEISEEKLAKEVKSKKKNFLLDKIASDKHKKYLDAKIEELKGKDFKIQDIDLVTEKDATLAISRNKAAYKAIEEQANLSFFDKVAKVMGFSTKKTQELEAKQKEFGRVEGLKHLKEKYPELFSNADAKFRKFVENAEEASKEALKNKKFWISLAVNLFMITASCYALNWAHPRLKELIDKHKNADQQSDNKKVEVNA